MTDRELMQMALDVITKKSDAEIKTVNALQNRLAQPEPEPDSWYDEYGMHTHDPFEGVTPLYASPPKREWVGLHEHELEVLKYNDPSGERLKLAKAVEAKLKEKNS